MTAETLPVLETGWEPNTPADDTVLRHGVLALAATWEAIGRVVVPDQGDELLRGDHASPGVGERHQQRTLGAAAEGDGAVGVPRFDRPQYQHVHHGVRVVTPGSGNSGRSPAIGDLVATEVEPVCNPSWDGRRGCTSELWSLR